MTQDETNEIDEEIKLPSVSNEEYTRLVEAIAYARDNAVTSTEAHFLRRLNQKIHSESQHPK